MSSYQWVRFETNFPGNLKVLRLVSAKKWQAIAVYSFALAHCGAQGKGGFIPKEALKLIHATPKVARDLVEAGLWEEAPDGWVVHDHDDYNPASQRKLSPSERGKKAANARWHPEDEAPADNVLPFTG
jgi:hypothetical protein